MELIAERLLPIAQSGNAAVLLQNDYDLAWQLKADGVEIPAHLQLYRSARSSLGDKLAIGVYCAGNRHSAMELAEAGVDYVRLDPFAPGPGDESVLGWWSELFEIPIATAGPLQAEEIARAARLGADFVRPCDDMWASERAATRIIGESMTAIEEAR